MLGVVFTEFIEMVEEKFSYDTADQIIENSGVGINSGFTAVENYDHADLVKLIGALRNVTGIEVDQLIRQFGEHLFFRFTVSYPELFDGEKSSLDFLEGVEGYIHVEVKKLYPHAELPQFDCVRHSKTCLEMNYKSLRPFGDLAHGLITGCGGYFGEKLEIQRISKNGLTEVKFTINQLD